MISHLVFAEQNQAHLWLYVLCDQHVLGWLYCMPGHVYHISAFMFVCFTLHEYFRVDDFSLLLLLLFNSWLAEYTSCQLTAQAVLLSTPPHFF